MAANSRSDFMLALTGDNVAVLSLKESSYDQGLRDVLGLTKLGDDGVPQGKERMATGIDAAMLTGCFMIRITYKKGSKKQSAVVICGPSKADTVFKDILGKTYSGKQITAARPIRRRVYRYF